MDLYGIDTNRTRKRTREIDQKSSAMVEEFDLAGGNQYDGTLYHPKLIVYEKKKKKRGFQKIYYKKLTPLKGWGA